MTEVEMIMDKNFCVKSAYWWPLKVRSSPNLLAWAKKPIWRVRPRKNTPSSWSHRPTCQRNQQRKKWTSARVALPVLTLTRSRWRSVCHTLVPFTVKFSTSKNDSRLPSSQAGSWDSIRFEPSVLKWNEQCSHLLSYRLKFRITCGIVFLAQGCRKSKYTEGVGV